MGNNIVKIFVVLVILGSVAFVVLKNSSQEVVAPTTNSSKTTESEKSKPPKPAVAEEDAGGQEEAEEESTQIRCVVSIDEVGTQKVVFYPRSLGCPEGATEEKEAAEEEEVNDEEVNDPDGEELPVEETGRDKDIVVVESREIRVFSPVPDEAVSSPIQIEGEARDVDGTVYLRVTNDAGKVLISETVPVYGGGADTWGTFKWTISYEFQSTKSGYLEVYSTGEANLLKIPITFN